MARGLLVGRVDEGERCATMTTVIDTAQECADAFERIGATYAEMMLAWRRVAFDMPPFPHAAAASRDILEASDKMRGAIDLLENAVRKLRAIGQGAAVADEWPDIPTAKPITRPLADTSRLEAFAKGEDE